MIINDKQIIEYCQGEHPMMSPFVAAKSSSSVEGAKVPSYGLNSYGYDIRIRPNSDIRVCNERSNGYLDPIYPDENNFKKLRVWIDGNKRRFVMLPAHSVVLALAEPYFEMPSDVIGVVQGKSTYARNGVIPLVTPLEAGWRGDLTLEFTNMSPLSVYMYLDGGVAQILFFKGDEVLTTYQGNYQDQSGLTLGRVK